MNINPVLSEIQGLSPAAQGALAMAGHAMSQPVITPQMKASTTPQDAGPVPTLSPMHMESPAPIMNAPAEPNVSGPIRGTQQGDQLERQRLLQTGPGVDQIANRIEGSGFGQNHPILGRILGNVAEGAGKIGDIGLHAASQMFAPGLDRAIPGTTANHDRLLGGVNTSLEQDLANVQKTAQTQNEEATAGKTNAETPTVAPLAQSRENLEGAQAGHENAATAGLPQEEADKHAVVAPTVAHLNAETTALGTPKEKNPQEQTFDSLLKSGMTPMQAYEKIREKPAGTSNAGTWQIEEDATTGKPVEYNTKTGQTKDAPNIAKAGTHAKAEAATAPAKQAIDYADSYKGGIHTGPGDEALMEKFFELAKPSTGFRMSTPQIDMLKNARDWSSSLEAHLRHATTGTWFSDDQRNQIVGTMHDLAKAKGLESGSGNGDMITVQIPGQPSGQIHSSQRAAFFAKYPNATEVKQ